MKLPILFFLYEIILLNRLLPWLRANQRSAICELRDTLLRYLLRYVDRTDNTRRRERMATRALAAPARPNRTE